MAKHELAALENRLWIVREKPAIETLFHPVKAIENQMFSLREKRPATFAIAEISSNDSMIFPL